MTSTQHEHSSRWPYFVVSALWLLLAVLFASQLTLANDVPVPVALRHTLGEWMPWILMSPLIFWLAEKFPVERPRWWRGLLVNVPVTIAAVLIAEFTFVTVEGLRGGQAALRSAPARELRPGPADADGDLPAPPEMRPPGRRDGRNGPFAGPLQHLFSFHLPLCLFNVMAAHAYAYFRRYQEKERKAVELASNLAEARLMALQMQLQPHFLFNTLNALATLVHTKPDVAEDMITNLSELLRCALTAGNRRELSLREELGYLECYLAIERVRFGDRLQVEWRVDPATHDASVPVLILQPIVENAVRYGVERRQVDVGRITITTSLDGAVLRLTVADTGPGLSVTSAGKGGHGVGLANTRTRLATLYGAEASVRLEDRPEGGCIATVELPFKLQTLRKS